MSMSSNLGFTTRRALLLGSGALFAWGHAPKLARAEGRDPRFLTVILRGALDGLAMVAPVGDPDWSKLRGDKALTLEGTVPALSLDGFFALNPAMPNLHRLYRLGEAIVVHAAATPYRERSHFDGQDVLESGLERPGRADSGWLNRALALLEPDTQSTPRGGNIFAVGPTTPLVVRGAAPVMLWDASSACTGASRHCYAGPRPLPSHGFGTCARARGAHRPRSHHAGEWNGAQATRRKSATTADPGAGAFLFCRSCCDHSQISRKPRGATDWRACLQRLGHAHQRRRCQRHARSSVRGSRWRHW